MSDTMAHIAIAYMKEIRHLHLVLRRKNGRIKRQYDALQKLNRAERQQKKMAMEMVQDLRRLSDRCCAVHDLLLREHADRALDKAITLAGI